MKDWVRHLILVGGGTWGRQIQGMPGVPNYPLLGLFPQIQELTIFAMGWGTAGIFTPYGLDNLAEKGILRNIRKLAVTATSEQLFKGPPMGQNWSEITQLLIRLPSLRSLHLRGFIYQIPFKDKGNPDFRPPTPPFELKDLKVDDCSLSMESFDWLVSSSYDSLTTLGKSDLYLCGFSRTTREPKCDGTTTEKRIGCIESEKRVQALGQRLGVNLPLDYWRNFHEA